MSLAMRWVGESELDRVAEARLLCYAAARNELPRFQEGIRTDRRAADGDYLLAERDGRPVGTATALSMTMWVSGAAFPCQGVAWVGAIRTERRKGGRAPGVATEVMHEVIRHAREREQVLSALMPFRATFYEHFGYGLVERRVDWTVPLSLLPAGESDGIRVAEAADLPALTACRQGMVERNQCDIERSPEAWRQYLELAQSGWLVVDMPVKGGPARGFMHFQTQQQNGRDLVRVLDLIYDDLPALRRQLHFLNSLRDQYGWAILSLPADLPLNWLLREPQIPHRIVSHATAEARPYTRMQLRVLEHAKLLNGLRLPGSLRGSVVVAVHECEGNTSRFKLELADGRASATPSSQSPGIECADRVWAAVVCGDLPARTAWNMGLLQASTPDAVSLLDAFSAGPAPFCREYF